MYCTECKSKYLSYFDKHLLNIFKEYEKVFLMAKNEFTDVEDTKYNILKSLFFSFELKNKINDRSKQYKFKLILYFCLATLCKLVKVLDTEMQIYNKLH